MRERSAPAHSLHRPLRGTPRCAPGPRAQPTGEGGSPAAEHLRVCPKDDNFVGLGDARHPAASARTRREIFPHFEWLRASPGGASRGGPGPPPVVALGLRGAILPYPKIQAEAGFDLIDQPGDAGKYPLFFNAKVGTPEDDWFKGPPALAGLRSHS